MTMFTLGILNCDELSEALKPDYESYARMFEELFGRYTQLEVKRYEVLEGHYPQCMSECSAYLITGSKTGVYDDEHWLGPLADFIRAAYADSQRLMGICFVHQMIAHTLGGEARKSNKGWGVGALTHTRQSEHAWMTPMPERITLLYSHQDQVVALPKEAELLYGSEFCPVGAYWVPGRVLSFQGHPEFNRDYCRRLMEARKDRYAPGQFESGMNSLCLDIDTHYPVRWLLKFMKGEDIS